MDNKKAEQEVGALITGITLLGMVFPLLLVWSVGRFHILSQRLVEIGVLEQSERVVFEISNGIGLDIGKLFILSGLILLIGVLTIRIIRIYFAKN